MLKNKNFHFIDASDFITYQEYMQAPKFKEGNNDENRKEIKREHLQKTVEEHIKKLSNTNNNERTSDKPL